MKRFLIALSLALVMGSFIAVVAWSQGGNPQWPGTIGVPPAKDINSSDWVPYLPWDPSYAQAEPGFKYYNSSAGVRDEDWNYFSFRPYLATSSNLNTPEQFYGVSGFSADKAWQYSTGNPHIFIAVLDCGIKWNDKELQDKFHLNYKELPPPYNATLIPSNGGFITGCVCTTANGTTTTSLTALTSCVSSNGHYNWSCYDWNKDGAFNIADYDASQGGAGYAWFTDPLYPTGKEIQITDQNGNNFIDPEDLIILFGQDGVDEDHDGYARDICGWNFRDNNNDPWDLNGYGHGTGEAEDSTAPGNDTQVGSPGVCPQCQVMPVRVGDSFVADANHFAEGVLFAVDSGASVIQEALGTIDMPAFAQEAMDYAYDHNVPIIASAADEDSMHHNYPASGNHTIMVHAIATNNLGAASNQPITTFLAFNNCTNYGAHLVLSVPGDSCSSEATGKSSGMSGILESMAFTEGIQLTANDIKQILTLTADDINIPNSVPGSTNYDPTIYESLPGWDQYFGYGRSNLYKAVLSVTTTAIPPDVDITYPRWFQTVDPVTSSTLNVYGTVSARWASSYDYEVQYGIGVTPATFVTACQQSGLTVTKSGLLCSINLSGISIYKGVINKVETWTEGGANDYALTIRVRVFDNSHKNIYELPTSDAQNRLYGEDRRQIFVHHDPDLFPNYPIYIGSSMESSPVLVDLYGTGKDVLLVGGSDGKVYGFDDNGNPLPGFPLSTDVLDVFNPSNPANTINHLNSPAYAGGTITPASPAILATIAVGDLLGNGITDIVAATMDGHVYAWDYHGNRLPGFPVHINYAYSDLVNPPNTNTLTTNVLQSLNCLSSDPKCEPNPKKDIPDHAIFASPVLYPLSGKGLDIIVAAQDQHIYIWDGTGALITDFAVYDPDPSHYRQYTRILSTPAVGDILGNGKVQIAVGTNELYNMGGRAYVLNLNGTIAAGWPQALYGPQSDILPYVGVGIPDSPVVFKDGTAPGLKVAFNVISGDPVIFNPDGTVFQNVGGKKFPSDVITKETGELTLLSNMSVGSLLGTGDINIVYGAVGLNVLNMAAFGGLREPFDHLVAAWSVDNDGYIDHFPMPIEDWQMFNDPIIADISGNGMPDIIEGSAGYQLWAWDANGDIPQGWPKFTGGWMLASAAVGDVQGNGYLAVAAATREGNLYLWKTKGPANDVQWPKFHHDLWNTGNYETALPSQHGPASSSSSGCSCNTTSKTSGTDAMLAFLIALIPLAFVLVMKKRKAIH